MARPVALIKSDFPTLDEVAETYNISSSRRKKLDAFIVDYLNNQTTPTVSKAAGETASKVLEKPSSQRAGLRKKKK